MNPTYLLILTEAISFMRAAMTEKPVDAKALVGLGLAAMKSSESPAAPQHIGERSLVHVPLEQVAACIMAGKGFAELHPDAAASIDAPSLAAIETALADGAPSKPVRKKVARG